MKKAFSLAVLVALSGSVFAADPQPAPVPNLAKPGETITPAPAAAPVAAPRWWTISPDSWRAA